VRRPAPDGGRAANHGGCGWHQVALATARRLSQAIDNL
jgi:hypothetical protein